MTRDRRVPSRPMEVDDQRLIAIIVPVVDPQTQISASGSGLQVFESHLRAMAFPLFAARIPVNFTQQEYFCFLPHLHKR